MQHRLAEFFERMKISELTRASSFSKIQESCHTPSSSRHSHLTLRASLNDSTDKVTNTIKIDGDLKHPPLIHELPDLALQLVYDQMDAWPERLKNRAHIALFATSKTLKKRGIVCAKAFPAIIRSICQDSKLDELDRSSLFSLYATQLYYLSHDLQLEAVACLKKGLATSFEHDVTKSLDRIIESVQKPTAAFNAQITQTRIEAIHNLPIEIREEYLDKIIEEFASRLTVAESDTTVKSEPIAKCHTGKIRIEKAELISSLIRAAAAPRLHSRARYLLHCYDLLEQVGDHDYLQVFPLTLDTLKQVPDKDLVASIEANESHLDRYLMLSNSLTEISSNIKKYLGTILRPPPEISKNLITRFFLKINNIEDDEVRYNSLLSLGEPMHALQDEDMKLHLYKSLYIPFSQSPKPNDFTMRYILAQYARKLPPNNALIARRHIAKFLPIMNRAGTYPTQQFLSSKIEGAGDRQTNWIYEIAVEDFFAPHERRFKPGPI